MSTSLDVVAGKEIADDVRIRRVDRPCRIGHLVTRQNILNQMGFTLNSWPAQLPRRAQIERVNVGSVQIVPSSN